MLRPRGRPRKNRATTANAGVGTADTASGVENGNGAPAETPPSLEKVEGSVDPLTLVDAGFITPVNGPANAGEQTPEAPRRGRPPGSRSTRVEPVDISGTEKLLL